jgi:hypothetical protein
MKRATLWAAGTGQQAAEAPAPEVDPMDWRERVRSAVKLLPPRSAVAMLGRGDDAPSTRRSRRVAGDTHTHQHWMLSMRPARGGLNAAIGLG